MGLDGGTIITRSDVLRGQSWRMSQQDTTRSSRGGAVGAATTYKEAKLAKSDERAICFSCCALSSNPLVGRVVCCGLGRLYLRDAVVELVLARRNQFADSEAVTRYMNMQRVDGDAFAHINSLKDVFDVSLTVDAAEQRAPTSTSAPPAHTTLAATAAAAASAAAAAAAGPSGSARGSGSAPEYVCPVTLTSLGHGISPVSALRPCGHVLTDRALANVTDSTCPACSKAYSQDKGDVVPVCGTPEQVAELRRMLGERAAQANARKSKKAQRGEGESEGLQEGKRGGSGAKRQKSKATGSGQD